MKPMQERTLSVVIPVYNEADTIARLHAEIQRAVGGLAQRVEVIWVNDGSTDNSLAEMLALPAAVVIDLNRNYGQATALDAGFKYASGDIVVSLDGDGQNDPADIPTLMAKLDEECLDVVAGWRRERKDPGSILVVTHVARFLRHLFIGDPVHDSGCTLRVYRREAVKSLDIGGEMHRYVLALLRWKGFRIGEVEVAHRPRIAGESKYRSTKAVRGLIDLFYVWFIHKYSQRPLHLFGYLALMSFALGVGTGLWSLYGKLAWGLSLNRNGWFFLAFFFLLAGILFFSLGIVIDLLLRTQLTLSPHEKRYYVRSTTRT